MFAGRCISWLSGITYTGHVLVITAVPDGRRWRLLSECIEATLTIIYLCVEFKHRHCKEIKGILYKYLKIIRIGSVLLKVIKIIIPKYNVPKIAKPSYLPDVQTMRYTE